MKQILLISILTLTAVSAAVAAGPAPYQVVESGRSYAKLQDAVEAIGASDGTIVIQPGVYRDCAVQTQGRIAYRAAVPGQTIFDGAVCESKAPLVFRNSVSSVDGIVFQNIFVPDRNGAGIHLENSHLKVTRSIFRDSQQGIISGVDEAGSVTVDQSTFSGLGRCDEGHSCSHSIYVGRFGSLSVTNSRFERGSGGHYIKSRAAKANIANNAIDDSMGNGTNYLIDLPHGAAGIISGNYFVQGKNKENAGVLIAIAAEGRIYDSSQLTIDNNDAALAPGATRQPGFLVNWSQDTVNLASNRLGPGIKPFEQR
jgi:hypothetical protein